MQIQTEKSNENKFQNKTNKIQIENNLLFFLSERERHSFQSLKGEQVVFRFVL